MLIEGSFLQKEVTMQHLLSEYMEKRMQDKGVIPVNVRNGPVVTISREAGCSANLIASILLSKIDFKISSEPVEKWRIVNKEIVINAAKELDLPPERINYIFKAEDRKLMDEIIAALSSRYYKSDILIRKTIIRGIRSNIEDGYLILVGRGGVAFTRRHPAALNIMLHAPVEWRIQQLNLKYGLSPKEAEKQIIETDRERHLLVEHFYGSHIDHKIYDLLFNTSSFKPEEVAEAIFRIMLIKKMI